MKLECPICFNLLSEEPDLTIKPDPDGNPAPVKKRRRCSDDDDKDSPFNDPRQESAELAATKCGHLFHRHCVLSWFATNLNCPTCRKPSPDGVEELRNVFLPTPNGDDSQLLLRNTTGELEITKNHLKSLAEENKSLKKKVKVLASETFVKERCSRKLQSDKDVMEETNNKLEDRYQRLWDQWTDLRQSYDLLKRRANGLEHEGAQFKRADLSRGGVRRGRGRRGGRGRGGSQNLTSSNNSIVLVDLTDE